MANKKMKTLARDAEFEYSGSVVKGLTLVVGDGYTHKVSSEVLSALTKHFFGMEVDLGTSRTDPPEGSIGEWLIGSSSINLASYIGPVLVEEGFADTGMNGKVIKIIAKFDICS